MITVSELKLNVKDILQCPRVSLDPAHYYKSGKCRCKKELFQ